MQHHLTMYETDSLSILVPVQDQLGAIVPLAGATLEAAVQHTAGPPMPIVATIRDAAKGLASLFVTPGQLGRGSYILQLRVALEGEVQTVVSEPLNVLPSIKVTQ